MSVGHISTYAVHQNTLRDATKVQQTLSDLQSQISSGSKSQDFSGLGGSTSEQFLLLENKIAKSDSYINDNNLVQTRINATDNALGQVIEAATSLKSLISQRRNISSNTAAFPDGIRGVWQTIVDQLNTNLGGRYIFSGTRTDTPPVDTQSFPTLREDGIPDDGYYNGSKHDVTTRANDSTEITYNVRADDEGIQKIFAGLAMAMKGHDAGSDADLRKAYDLVSEGLEGVISTQAIVNQHKVQIDNINTQHESLKLYFKGIKDDIANTDIVAASTQVAINQGILQASFQTFAKINSLRLSDYLR